MHAVSDALCTECKWLMCCMFGPVLVTMSPPTYPQVYHRDVLVRLSEGRVESSEDIEWLRVLRFYQEGEVRRECCVHGSKGLQTSEAEEWHHGSF